VRKYAQVIGYAARDIALFLDKNGYLD